MVTFFRISFVIAGLVFLSACSPSPKTEPASPAAPAFTPVNVSWPEGKKAAVSLTFDDARLSQIDRGLDFFEKQRVKATFYLIPGSMEQRAEGWKKAVAQGHEIGNHSLTHPCSGNFLWAREKALEDFDMEKMIYELEESNRQIYALLGVVPESFAYPCGQKFIGRGVHTQSYIPLIAEKFTSGRGFKDEVGNDPSFCDPAQLTGVDMDMQDFEQILPYIQNAENTGQWLVFAGHEIGDSGSQTTRVAMLEQLIAYAQNPENGIWLAPVKEISSYIASQRGK
ncbi:MAG: polysaccharide deacetylase family protein [Bacteroidia bacterium]